MIEISKKVGNKVAKYRAERIERYCSADRVCIRIITTAGDRCLFTLTKGFPSFKAHEGNTVNVAPDVVNEAFSLLATEFQTGNLAGAYSARGTVNQATTNTTYMGGQLQMETINNIQLMQAQLMEQMNVLTQGMNSMLQNQANQAQLFASQANINMMQFNMQQMQVQQNMLQMQMQMMSNVNMQPVQQAQPVQPMQQAQPVQQPIVSEPAAVTSAVVEEAQAPETNEEDAQIDAPPFEMVVDPDAKKEEDKVENTDSKPKKRTARKARVLD